MAFSGGDGTIGNPYQITTAEQLRDCINYLSSYFKLMSDIDLGLVDFIPIGGYNSLGEKANLPFTGEFDGNNHIISGLKISATSDSYGIGLFGYIQHGSLTPAIYDLTISDVEMYLFINSTSFASAGGMVGRGTGYIANNCHVGSLVQTGANGGLTSTEAGGTGGFIGNAVTNAKIVDCSVGSVSLQNGKYIGGFAGTIASGGYIENCHVLAGSIASNDIYNGFSGGFIGVINRSAQVTKCSTYVNLTGNCNTAGGFVGWINFYSTTIPMPEFTIKDCFARGNVENSRKTAGFCGEVYGFTTYGTCNIINSYCSGSVVCSNPGSYANNGFLTAYIPASIVTTSCYYDSTVSGYTDDTYATHKTTAEMKAEETFIDWDFVDIWRITEGVTYPDFEDRPPPGPGPTPKMLIRWMNNNSGIWSYAREISLGDKGDTNLVATIKRLGAYKTRQYEFVISSDVPVVITAIEEEIQGEDRLKQ